MTREDIIKMAREAGMNEATSEFYADELERFFHMAQAAEREEILDMVGDYAKNNADLTAAIRARGTK